MVTTSVQSNSTVSHSHSTSSPCSSQINSFITVNQEEMCEKLIQLSFVKIVSSKSERGGARLRKNLLILHLLQKARMEQRNRLLSSRTVSISQQPEVTAEQSSVNGWDMESGNGRSSGEGRIEKIDISASLSQQASEPHPDVGDVITQAGQTSLENVGANIQPGSAPDCRDASDCVSINGDNGECGPSDHHTSSQDHSSSARRASMKRKREYSENGSSSIDYNTSPKLACTVRHRSIDQPQQQSTGPNLNELLCVIKTAALAKPQEENEEDSSAVEPVSTLSRSLSCSSLMELTCES